MMHRAKTRPRVRLRSLFVWHRYLGVIAAALVLVLAVTGLLLNHTEPLELDRRHIDNKALLGWYGIDAPMPGRAFRSNGHTIVRYGHTVYVDKIELGETSQNLVGAVAAGPMLVVAAEDTLWMTTQQGQLIERLDRPDGISGRFLALGVTPDGRAAVRTARGVYVADPHVLTWSPDNARDILWARAIEPPDKLLRTLRRRHRGRGPSVERVVLDLHSGRILGSWGIYVMDAAAVLMVVLAGTGTWMWYRNWRGRRRRRRELNPKG